MTDPRQSFRQKIWSLLSSAGKTPPAQKEYRRQHLWEVLEHGRGRTSHIINTFLFVMILLSILIIPLEFIPGLERYDLFTEAIEVFVTAVFTIEYGLRIYAAPYRWRYIFSWWGVIDLISILPYYLSQARIHSEVLRFLRLVRVVRILKIAKLRAVEDVQHEAREKSSTRLGLMESEEVQRVVMQHPIFFVIGLILPLILGAAALAVILMGNFHQIALTIGAVLFFMMLLFLYKAWIDYHYDIMYITNKRIIFQNAHLFGWTRNEVEYRDITNIRPTHTGFFSYILGYGSIIIETASDQSMINETHVRHHEEVAKEIHARCYQRKSYLPAHEQSVAKLSLEKKAE